MKNSLFIFSILTALSSCLSEKQEHFLYLKMKVSDTINLPALFKQQTSTISFDYYINEDSAFLLLYYAPDHQLVEYDLAQRIISKRIDVSVCEWNTWLWLKYLDRNRVAIVFEPARMPDYSHASILYLADLNSRTIDSVPFDSNDLIMMGDDRSNENILYLQNWFSKLSYQDAKLYVNLESYESNINSSGYTSRFPIGGHFHFSDTNTEFFTHNVYHESSRCPLPSQYESPISTIGHDNKVVYSFAYSHNLYIYNEALGEVTQVEAKPQYFQHSNEEIGKCISEEQKSPTQVDPFSFEYHKIIYDPFRKQYYRFMKMPVHEESSVKTQKRGRSDYLIIYNEDFTIAGEGVLPDNLTYNLASPYFINSDGIYFILKDSKVQSMSEISFGLLEIQYEHTTYSAVKERVDSIRTRDFLNNSMSFKDFFFQSFDFVSDTNVVLYTPSFGVCPYCINEVAYFFDMNSDNYSNLYLLLSDNNEQKTNELFESLPGLETSKNLFIDRGSLIEEIITTPPQNPIIYIVVGDEFLQKIHLDPNNSGNLMPLIDAYLNE